MIPPRLLERFAEKRAIQFTLNLISRFLRLYPDTDCVYANIPRCYIMDNDLLKLNISLNTCQPSYALPATIEEQ